MSFGENRSPASFKILNYLERIGVLVDSQLSLFYGLSFLTVALAFAFAVYLYLWVKKQKSSNAKIQEVSLLIKEEQIPLCAVNTRCWQNLQQ